MGTTNARGRLFIFMALVAMLPLLQHSFSIIESGKLDGVFFQNHDISFSFEKWWDGSYQKQKTLFLNDSTGFRPDLVRLNNQVNCTMFRKLAGSDAFLGYDEYLFSKVYVDDYEGRLYQGEELLSKEVRKLRKIQDTLERLGKTFLFTYAPSKPYVFPDKIPSILRPYGKPKTNNYTTLKRISDSLGIKQLDYNALFMRWRNSNPNITIPKQGFHWSVYGSLLAADTLIKYIERERSIKMPELEITKMNYSDIPRSSDNDIAAAINLIFPITKEHFCYPDFHFSTSDTKTKPRTIFIGDSFIWQWVYQGVLDSVTTDWEYWYYFRDVYTRKNMGGEPGTMDNYDWPKALQNSDCVVAVFTPMNFDHIGDKAMFIEKMYSHFYPDNK